MLIGPGSSQGSGGREKELYNKIIIILYDSLSLVLKASRNWRGTGLDHVNTLLLYDESVRPKERLVGILYIDY